MNSRLSVILFLSSAFLSFTSMVSAQNRFYVGGQIGVSIDSSSSSDLNDTSSSNSRSYSISPDFGVLMGERWILGLRLSYVNSTQNATTYFGDVTDSRTNIFGIAPFARFNCLSMGDFALWFEGEVNGSFSFRGNQFRSVGADISPIITWQPLEHFTFYTSLDFLSLGYSYSESRSGNSYDKVVSSKFHFGANTNNILNLSNLAIGVYFTF